MIWDQLTRGCLAPPPDSDVPCQACHGTCIFTTRRCHGLRSKGQSHFGAHAATTVVSGNLSQPVGWERWTGEAKYCTVTNLALTCSHPRLWVRILVQYTALIPPKKICAQHNQHPPGCKLHPSCIARRALHRRDSSSCWYGLWACHLAQRWARYAWCWQSMEGGWMVDPLAVGSFH